MCPADKTHAIVDLSMFLDVPATNQKQSKVNVYLTTSNKLSSNGADHILFKEVTLGIPEVSPEFSKIIVGPKQYLFVELVGEGPVNVRVSGLEENNPHVVKGGRLGYIKVNPVGIYEVYRLDTPLATYCSGTLALTNTTDGKNQVQVWVTDNEEVKSLTDTNHFVNKVQFIEFEGKETVFIENLTIAPNERIYIHSNKVNVVASYNGVVINAAL